MTIRQMTDQERRDRKVPGGVDAFIVILPPVPDEVILLRGYDIQTDTHPVRAFSPREWTLATEGATAFFKDEKA